MATHVVKQGECLLVIAQKYGFRDWKTVYDHPQNAEFKRQRPNPNILHPGDRVFIPDKTLKDESVPTGSAHRFVVNTHRHLIRVVLKGTGGQPYAGKKYQLKIGDKTYDGVTDDKGLLEKAIVGHEDTGVLLLWPKTESAQPLRWNLKLGELDPVEKDTGIQSRLNNLGFHCGAVDGAVGPRTQQALKAFQRKVGLEPSGKVDDATRDKLREMHEGG